MHERRLLAIGLLLALVAAAAGAAAVAVLPGGDGATFEADGTVETRSDENETQPEQNESNRQTVVTPATIDESEYDARVELYDGDWHVGPIYAETATTGGERYTGLSDHESLDPWEGMLFVYDEPDDHTYVMRDMSFGIDIVYVDADGCVTTAHAADQPAPDESGEEDHHRYPGYGMYVLEVPQGVATDAGVDAGDPVRIEHDGEIVNGRGQCEGAA